MLSGLKSYLDSIRARDPAPRSRWEILLYPGAWAVFLHRIAHWLFEARMYFLARLVNHFSRFLTAIESVSTAWRYRSCSHEQLGLILLKRPAYAGREVQTVGLEPRVIQRIF